MTPVVIVVLVVWAVSALGLVVTVLLHSGKGTGVSDAIASSVYSSQTGMKVVERNLDRVTVVFAVVFMASLLVLMVLFPQGTIPTAG